MRPERLYTAYGLIALVLWATLSTLTIFSGPIPPFQLTAMGFTIAFMATWILWGVKRQSPWALFRQSPKAWLVGLYGLFGFHAFYFAALTIVPPAEAMLTIQIWPLAMQVMAALWLREAFYKTHLIGTALSLVGVGTLILTSPHHHPAHASAANPGQLLLGFACAVACVLIWATYSIWSRQLKDVPTDFLGWICGATGVLAWLCHFALEPTRWPASTGAWLAVIGLGLGPVGLSFFAWDAGMKRGNIVLIGTLAYLEPVLSVSLLVLVGIAQPTLWLGAACLLVVGGSFIASQKPKHNAHHQADVFPGHPSLEG